MLKEILAGIIRITRRPTLSDIVTDSLQQPLNALCSKFSAYQPTEADNARAQLHASFDSKIAPKLNYNERAYKYNSKGNRIY